MNTEENITPEVKELLDALAEPRVNRQRQQQLSELIDSLTEQEKASHRKRHTWRWVGIGAVAACLALFIIRMPSNDASLAIPESVASTEVPMPDSMVVEEVIATKPATPAQQAAHHTPILLAQAQTPETVEELETIVVEKQFEAISTTEEEVTPVPNTIQPIQNPVQPTRRVVGCHNLVCYDCKTKRDRKQDGQASDKTILGTPISPNMDEGMLMLASL